MSYNKAVKLAGDLADFATREILEKILNDEDVHIDKIEELQDQIGHMGIGDVPHHPGLRSKRGLF